MKKWCIAIGLVLLVAGCMTPMQRLAIAEQGLISTGRLLITARNAGCLTQAEWLEIQASTRAADRALDAAHALIVAGEDIQPAIRTFNTYLDELIEMRALATRRKKGGG